MMNDTSSSSHLGFCQPSTVCLADTTLLSPPLPEPVVVTKTAPKEEKKPVKKRKSWGQELPVPKTNLPPRKRAKTEDEKEQRRIERVLRNRQAAQSSRERKRQEVEKLEGERDVINQQNHLLRQRLLQVEEEKFKLKQEVMEMRALLGKQTGAELTPSATPSPLLRSEMFHEKPDVKSELADLPLFPTESGLDTPVSALTPKDDPLPAPLDLTGTATSTDLTQHPAVSIGGGEPADEVTSSDERRGSVGSRASTRNATPLSDNSFEHLFNSGDSPLPAPSFFEEGLAAADADRHADALHLDSLVDLDAPLASPVHDFVDFGAVDPAADQYPFDFLSINDTVVDFSHQSAATLSHVQPCIGASS